MNVGIVTTWFERGASYVSKNYERALSADCNVFIYARGGEIYARGDSNWDQKNVTWGKGVRLSVPTAIDLRDFKRWLLEKDIHVVIFNEQHYWPPILMCNDMGIKTGAYVDYYTEETIPFFACYDFLLCNTLRHLEAFKWHRQAWYIPWGTDLGLFRPKIKRTDEDVITFFHSAGMSPQRKGTDLLLAAFSKIDEPARLIIHSQVALREALPSCAGTIDRLVKSGKLTIIEKSVPAPGLYHLGDVYVYPSRLDGLGLTMIEALACGLPVIATNSPPMNEFINEETGQLVKTNRCYARSDGYYWPQSDCDIDDLAEKMEHYIHHIGSIEQYQKCARDYAEQHFDWNRNTRGLAAKISDCPITDPSERIAITEKILHFEQKRARYSSPLYLIDKWGDAIFRSLKQ